MKNNKTAKYVLLSVLGLLILAAGLVIIKTVQNPQGILRTVPYIAIGIGTGIFGQNLGTVISRRALRNDPQAAKRIEIETKDERNTAIRNRAKAKAYDLMVMVFGALMLAFALMQVEMYAVLALVAAYLFVVFSSVYYINKYQKDM